MNDFDFFTGTWDIANRWRTDFLDPGSGWEEFPASATRPGTSAVPRTSTRSPWEQAFSTDGGQNWLDNWYMDATRRPS